jgi:hypothetical protein
MNRAGRDADNHRLNVQTMEDLSRRDQIMQPMGWSPPATYLGRDAEPLFSTLKANAVKDFRRLVSSD